MLNNLWKKGIVLGIIVLFVGVSIIPTTGMVGKLSKSTTDRDILYVGGSGLGNYSTIQEAIDNASDGDTVFVYDESSPYYENVIIDKSINLIGENRNTTVIDGSGTEDVVYVSAGWVNISEFMIQNSGNSVGDGGIDIRSNYNNIFGNNILNNYRGIRLEYSSNNVISGNTINLNSHPGIGIYSSSNNNTITGNTISLNSHGILLYYYCKNNTISGNIFSNNYHGICLWYSSSNTITGNTIPNNQYGISLDPSSNNNTISGNSISNNSVGINLYSSSNNNTIYNNYFNNTHNAYDTGNNTWNITKTNGTNIIGGPYLGGNFWSDYNGSDADGDGIGDTPYPIPNGYNMDYLPLVEFINSPPETPTITGPNSGEPGVEYTYCIDAFDPDNDSLYVLWNWGDGTGSDWLGPFESGMEVCDSHTWNETGTFTISVTVKDEHGATVTAYKEVTMPKNKAFNFNLLSWLFERFPNVFPILRQLLGL